MIHPLRENWPHHDYKTFVIHNKESHLSRWSANKTLITTKRCGVNAVLFDGVHKDNHEEEMKKAGLKWNKDAEHFCSDMHHLDSVAGCFMSHYKLWQKCLDLGQPIIILEHDAEFQSHIEIPKEFGNFEGVINIGRPLWGNWWNEYIDKSELQSTMNTKSTSEGEIQVVKRTFENCTKPHTKRAVQDKDRKNYCECDRSWLVGAHSYIITPSAAMKLLIKASKEGIDRADVFIDKSTVNIADLLPYPSHQIKRFSLIDKGWENVWMDSEWSLPTFKQEAAIYGQELVLPCSPKWKEWETWKKQFPDMYQHLLTNQTNTEKNIRYGKIMFDNNEVITGEHDGVFKDYYNDGETLRCEGVILDGEMTGEWKYYLTDGTLDVIYYMLEGKLEKMDRQFKGMQEEKGWDESRWKR